VTTSRTMWVIFCCAMASGWALSGFLLWFTVIVPLLAVVFVPGSLLAILIPVGSPPKRPPVLRVPPPCNRCGAPYVRHTPYGNAMVCPAPALPRGGGWR
jgi:hypothetical protein